MTLEKLLEFGAMSPSAAKLIMAIGRCRVNVLISGGTGSGKTTMLNIIGTIDKPSKGDVYICGLRIKYSTKDQLLASIRLNKLGFVFQTFNLIGSLTALENVELPMQLRGKLSREEIRKRATQLLTEVGLGERLDHFPNMLSGGE